MKMAERKDVLSWNDRGSFVTKSGRRLRIDFRYISRIQYTCECFCMTERNVAAAADQY